MGRTDVTTPFHVEAGASGVEDLGIPFGGTLQADIPYDSDLTSLSGWASISPGDKITGGYGLYAAAGTAYNLKYTTPSLRTIAGTIANDVAQAGSWVASSVGNIFGSGGASSAPASSTGK